MLSLKILQSLLKINDSFTVSYFTKIREIYFNKNYLINSRNNSVNQIDTEVISEF